MTVDNRINARIGALAAEVERRKLIREMPVDPLSQSLYEMGAELAALDELGVIRTAHELGIRPDDVRVMAQSLVRPII